jgi:KaiC/GvpD/RAD55 family RecA-like ATPase
MHYKYTNAQNIYILSGAGQKKMRPTNNLNKEFIMDYQIERVKTGIAGLDRLISGGFVKGSAVLISGKAGAGKTLFGLQFLWEGLQNGEPGIYMTFEETADDIRKDALSFGWDFSDFEKKGKFKLIEHNVYDNPSMDFFDVDKIKAERIVIDSISILSLMVEKKAALRNRMNNIVAALKRKGVTTLMISEAIDGDAYSRLGVEEFISDAVVMLDFVPVGPQAGRNLLISKMRRTKHSEQIHPIQISKGGMRVLSI